jgi:hypothetical protein
MSRMLRIFPVPVLAGTAVAALCLATVAPAVAAAAPDPTVLFNSQVNMTAPAPPAGLVDNFPQNKQNEPSITVDPATGALVAGSTTRSTSRCAPARARRRARARARSPPGWGSRGCT